MSVSWERCIRAAFLAPTPFNPQHWSGSLFASVSPEVFRVALAEQPAPTSTFTPLSPVVGAIS